MDARKVGLIVSQNCSKTGAVDRLYGRCRLMEIRFIAGLLHHPILTHRSVPRILDLNGFVSNLNSRSDERSL